jgi:hypothetical protein
MKHLLQIILMLFAAVTGIAVGAWQDRTGKELSTELRKDGGVVTVLGELYGKAFWQQLGDMVPSRGQGDPSEPVAPQEGAPKVRPYRTADGVPYILPALTGLELIEHSTRRIAVDDLKFTLTLIYQARRGVPLPNLQRVHPPRLIFETMAGTASILGSYLARAGVDLQECRSESYNLIVTVVEKAVLFDRKRFSETYNVHFGPDAPPGSALFGYYNSTPDIEDNSTVLVADVGADLSIEVLAHEYAHYFWDRFCLSTQLDKDSEAFAQAFGKYYVRDR